MNAGGLLMAVLFILALVASIYLDAMTGDDAEK